MSERAHAVWEREGRPGGQAERHWSLAEEELRAEEGDAAGIARKVADAIAGSEAADDRVRSS